MPVYTIEFVDGSQEDIICSWDDLQKLLKEDTYLTHVIKPSKVISGRTGQGMKAGGQGWKDLLTKIKKESGMKSTVKV